MEKEKKKIADIQSQMKRKCKTKMTYVYTRKCKLSTFRKRLPDTTLEFERKTLKWKKKQGGADSCPAERVFAKRREGSQNTYCSR